jgi:Cu(I)/Ag(I) efflux system membrane fusion protein
MKGKCKYDNSSKQPAVNFLLPAVYWLLAILFFAGCRSTVNENKKQEIADSTQKIIYYCPMHPDVEQDFPGKCPKPECHGMDLIQKMSSEVEKVLKPVNSSVLGLIKTTKAVFGKMPMDVETTGYIDYDDRTRNNISSFVSGRIEKLYIKYDFQPIHKGEKVFEIYSPELVTAQQNLAYILNNDPEETTLVESAKQKLKFLGFTDNMLNEIMKTKKIMQTVPVYSKYEGHVHESGGMEPPASSNGGMSAAKNENYGSAKILSVKEGQYVMMGETVLNVISNENTAVVIQIKAEDISKINKNAEAEITVEEGTSINGKIDFIEPILKPGAKTIAAKIYFNNKNTKYKIGSLVKARIKVQEFESLWIPVSALVDLGKKKIVWVKKDGNFEVKEIETGVRSGKMIEVSDGLTSDDEIAEEAHYLTDSEGFINTNEDEK